MVELAFLFLAGAYVGWNIGANDAANCIGTSVGSGLLSYRKGIILVGVFVIAGALLQGQHVMHTIGKGIVTAELPVAAVFAALLSAGLFVTSATFLSSPSQPHKRSSEEWPGSGWLPGLRLTSPSS